MSACVAALLHACRGEGEACPAASELYRMGWASAVAEMTRDSSAPGTWYAYTLPATYKSPRNMIRAKPSWVGAAYKRNVYVAVRSGRAGDAKLKPEFDGKVHIHVTNQDVDEVFGGGWQQSFLSSPPPLFLSISQHTLSLECLGLQHA